MKEQPPQIFIAQNSQLQTKTVGSKSSDIHCRLHERRTVYHSLKGRIEWDRQSPDSASRQRRRRITFSSPVTISIGPVIFFFDRFLFSHDMLVGLAAIGFMLGALWWGWTQIPLYFRKTIHRWLQRNGRDDKNH